MRIPLSIRALCHDKQIYIRSSKYVHMHGAHYVIRIHRIYEIRPIWVVAFWLRADSNLLSKFETQENTPRARAGFSTQMPILFDWLFAWSGINAICADFRKTNTSCGRFLEGEQGKNKILWVIFPEKTRKKHSFGGYFSEGGERILFAFIHEKTGGKKKNFWKISPEEMREKKIVGNLLIKNEKKELLRKIFREKTWKKIFKSHFAVQFSCWKTENLEENTPDFDQRSCCFFRTPIL